MDARGRWGKRYGDGIWADCIVYAVRMPAENVFSHFATPAILYDLEFSLPFYFLMWCCVRNKPIIRTDFKQIHRGDLTWRLRMAIGDGGGGGLWLSQRGPQPQTGAQPRVYSSPTSNFPLNFSTPLKPITYIAPQTANRSCSGALRHRQSGRADYRP